MRSSIRSPIPKSCTIGELVARFLPAVPVDDVMAYVRGVSAFDRYQASSGIDQTAHLVARFAQSIGLADVSVDHFPADGERRWWTFDAPVAWTPIEARLDIRSHKRSVLRLDHAQHPFAIATHSAATPIGGVEARLVNVPDSACSETLRGSVAVVDAAEFARDGLLAELVDAGIIGFVTDAQCREARSGLEFRGRIELDPKTTLFGFSLTSSHLALARAAACEGALAHVAVAIDRSATMPVVTGVLKGERPDGEIWLTAHLCHPRPGANDNASGVAALLGVAASLRAVSAGRARTIRFVWAPEFVGIAAQLYRTLATSGPRCLPQAVINLDMVGEDQAACGGPFVVERAADLRSSLLTPLAEHVVDEIFAQTSEYNGTWRSMPLTGGSDHAIFAHANTGCPAIQFCHTPDRFNHSAGDTFDKVSRLEMNRSIAAAAALAHIVANDGVLPANELRSIICAWCGKEEAAARRTAVQHGDVAWGQGLVHHVQHQNAAVLALAGVAAILPPVEETRFSSEPEACLIAPCWVGPLNIRAMMADAPAAARRATAALLRADAFNYVLLFNLAVRADGSRTRETIIRETSFALARPVDGATVDRLFDVLIQSGWVKEISQHV